MTEQPWMMDDNDTRVRLALGPELAVVADLFPRVANAIYIQMTSTSQGGATRWDENEFRKQVLKELPTTCEEVVPFFVRTVWNRKWTPTTHDQHIQALAVQFVQIVTLAGGRVTPAELVAACARSFENV